MFDTSRGRYIHVSRSVEDVVASYYYLYMSYKKQSGSIEYLGKTTANLDQFLTRFIKGRVMYGSWKKHVSGWRRLSGNPNVLYIRYEDLKADFDSTLSRILTFLDIELDSEQLARVTNRCSFAFMKQYEAKFEPTSEEVWENDYVEGNFIRNGGVSQTVFGLTLGQKQILAELEASAAPNLSVAVHAPEANEHLVPRRVSS